MSYLTLNCLSFSGAQYLFVETQMPSSQEKPDNNSMEPAMLLIALLVQDGE